MLTLLKFIKYYTKFIFFDIFETAVYMKKLEKTFETAVYMKKLEKTYLAKVPYLFLAKRGCLTILCERFGYFLKVSVFLSY